MEFISNSYVQVLLGIATLIGAYLSLREFISSKKNNNNYYDTVQKIGTQCLECGKYLSKSATQCTKCGSKQPFLDEKIFLEIQSLISRIEAIFLDSRSSLESGVYMIKIFSLLLLGTVVVQFLYYGFEFIFVIVKKYNISEMYFFLSNFQTRDTIVIVGYLVCFIIIFYLSRRRPALIDLKKYGYNVPATHYKRLSVLTSYINNRSDIKMLKMLEGGDSLKLNPFYLNIISLSPNNDVYKIKIKDLINDLDKLRTKIGFERNTNVAIDKERYSHFLKNAEGLFSPSLSMYVVSVPFLYTNWEGEVYFWFISLLAFVLFLREASILLKRTYFDNDLYTIVGFISSDVKLAIKSNA